ncbi:glycosyltransferase family 4 protein [Desulfonatronospira sp.]|uniref:glycosyltransferase family 4 protein n=1 Tax=Desulfonatronospira sp. TaxID=1962951 RepID=UPI0025C2C9B3|nr:glycosyltransferase family 4 protein [Desulfonatronospira sp.]
MKFIISKFKINLENYIKESHIPGIVVVFLLVKLLFVKDSNKKLSVLTRVLRHYPNIAFHKSILNYSMTLAKSDKIFNNGKNRIQLNHPIIIKPYISKKEKGILLMKFEHELKKVVNSIALETIQDRYHIVSLPSGHGLFTPQLLKLAARSSQRFYVMPVQSRDRISCLRLGPHCQVLPFNNASWVKKELFSCYKGHRDIDCLMVAQWGKVKRHWMLFKALSKLPPEITAVCVGVPVGDGRTVDSIRQEARVYGVHDRVTIIEGPSQEDLRNYFQRAKVFCALSYKEGTFNSVAESLMAGTPVIMFKNAHIGTKELINENNGALVSSISELRDKITYFLKKDNHEEIRKNAQQLVDAASNCEKLNHLLKEDAFNLGYEWSCDIESVYCVRLKFYYENPEWKSIFKEDYSYLNDNGVEIKRFL